MAIGDGLTATYHMNRLAGTIVKGVPQYDFDGACLKWGTVVLGSHNATRGIDVLNLIYASRNGNKNYYSDTPGILSMLAIGKTGLGEDEAARRIVS
jgi:hypothetical protein